MASGTPEVNTVPVVIIGGGGCGLTLSSILSDLDIEHVLFERHSQTSILPKAHYLNQRTMEIFRQHGMSDAIYAQGSAIRNMSQVMWQTSLGGDGKHDRKIIGILPSYGGAEGTLLYETYKLRDQPPVKIGSDQVSEPILLKLAQDRNPGNVKFDHKVTDVQDKGDHVMVYVKTSDGKEMRYKAQYAVGADGGKLVGPLIGAVMEGQEHLEDKVSVHFKADLSKYWDDRTLINHFINPEGGTITYSGALVVMGPTWGKHSEEWSINFGHRMDDPERFNENNLIPRLRQLLKIPDLATEVLHISHWIQCRVLASKFQQGRLFLAGDAAHKHPPTTGLGLNTAVQDAHNLAWKLAAVLKGQANPMILDSYETERRPVARRNCDWAAFTAQNRNVLNAAIGLTPGKIEENRARFEKLFEESESGATERAQVQKIIQSQQIEFSAHDLELGFRYSVDQQLLDGSDPPPVDPLGQTYHPVTRPGHRLPHAWLQKDGVKLSTHDLVGRSGAFCLITDEHGDDWVHVANTLSAKKIHLNVAQIKQDRFDDRIGYEDYDDSWAALRGISNGGAILVRPDNIVAWRSRNPSKCFGEELAQAIDVVLGEKVANGV